MSQLVFSICQNSEVGANADEEMDWLAKVRTSREKESFLSPCHLYRLQQRYRWIFHPSKVYPTAWILVNFRGSQVDKQELPAQAHMLGAGAYVNKEA